MKIGVFDSGVGGLSVLKSLIDARLFSEIIYYGDTARVPYGNKDKATIVRFSLEAVDFFIPHKIDMLIVACNTASAYALKEMQKIAPFSVIGVVESGILSLSNKIKNKKDSILIIATKATIKSGIYERELRKLGYENITSLQTGLFVPLVEEGIFEGELLEATMRYYFGALNSSFDSRNSPLELHSADFANLGRFADLYPVSHPKFAKNHESQTENPSVVLNANYANSSLRGRIADSHEAIQKNQIDCHDSALPNLAMTGNCVDCFGDESPRNDESDVDCHDSANDESRNDGTKSTLAIPKAIILACTHFPLIAHQIRAYFDNKPILIHSGEAIVEFLLKKYKLDSSKKRAPKVQFYASADKKSLQKTAKLWLKSL